MKDLKIRYTEAEKKDIIEWDIQNWSKSLRFYDQRIDFSEVHDALELGARSGGLSLWLALHGVKNIICSDYVDNTTLASGLHQKYSEAKSIRYETIDATHIPYEDHFDVIAFKSVLGAVGSISEEMPALAMEEMRKALKEGRKLVFSENLYGSCLHKGLRRSFVKWGRRWKYFHLDELLELTHHFKKVEYRTVGFFGAFARSPRMPRFFVRLCEVFDVFFAPLLPRRSRYIAIFVCEK